MKVNFIIVSILGKMYEKFGLIPPKLKLIIT